jgi:hypothetical protein
LGHEDYFLALKASYEVDYFVGQFKDSESWEITKPRMLDLLLTKKIQKFGKYWKSFFKLMSIGESKEEKFVRFGNLKVQIVDPKTLDSEIVQLQTPTNKSEYRGVVMRHRLKY